LGVNRLMLDSRYWMYVESFYFIIILEKSL
jgi:hypothetical protein